MRQLVWGPKTSFKIEHICELPPTGYSETGYPVPHARHQIDDGS